MNKETINKNRRNFIISGLTLTGGLAFGIPALSKDKNLQPSSGKIGFFIEVLKDNTVVIGSNQPEIGQGIRTALPMMIAEELDLSWSQVKIKQMPLGIVKTKDGLTWKYGGQGAGGSYATLSNWTFMREVGAKARELFIKSASKIWGISIEDCKTKHGFVYGLKSTQKASYASLITKASSLTIDDTKPKLKDPKNFKILGQPQNIVEAEDMVTGKANYGIDTHVEGMKIAMIKRCPYFDGKVLEYDDKETLKIDGVIKTLKIDGPEPGKPFNILASGVAVIAENTWAAMKGIAALKVKWDKGLFPNETTSSFKNHLKDLLSKQGNIVVQHGDFNSKFSQAEQRFSKRYFIPFVSHAPLEPQNCYAHVQDEKVHIIVPTQMPSGASRSAAAETGIDRMSITVEMTRVGGGFGRRLTNDYVAEACIISKATGYRIKLLWTREEDMQHDFYRPSGLHEMKAGLDKVGKVIAWQQRLASASKYYRRPNVPEADYWKPELYPNQFPETFIPNFQLEYHSAKSGITRGSWRAPAHTANAFVIQSFIDELAYHTKQNPLDLHLKLLSQTRSELETSDNDPSFDPNRLKKILKLVAEKINFNKPRKKGTGVGIASHFTFSGYAAHAIEVSVTPKGQLTINKVIGAIDCGFAVNPRGVEAQMQGGTIDGLSTALNLEITVNNGRVEQSNFHDYPIMRQKQMPKKMEFFIVNSSDTPNGVGEIPIPPVAPALTNAIFAATGLRIRKLPIQDQIKDYYTLRDWNILKI